MDTALGFHGTGLERAWNGLERGLERDGQIFQKIHEITQDRTL